MKHNKWEKDYDFLTKSTDETILLVTIKHFISSLLKEQRKKQVKEVGTLLVVDVEQEIKPYDVQLIMEMKANHNEMVRKYNLAVVKVLSILKGNKE